MSAPRFILSLVSCAAMGLMFPALVSGETLELTGVVRDFMRGDWDGGHPDFETANTAGHGSYGLVKGLTSMDLDENRKPIYNPQRPSNDTIESPESFSSWYYDVLDINLSVPLTIALDNNQSEPGGIYTYVNYAFWPINGAMFGNQSLSKNFHFTFELHTLFGYMPGQTFTFSGDDDVWVYIKGKKVIDIGGVHSSKTANVLLFDGKAFVTKAHFTFGGDVLKVSSAMHHQMHDRWNQLNLPGDSPISENDYYIDLDLNNGTDVRCAFNDTSVTCYSAQDLSNVVLKFEDSTEQKFDNLNTGSSGTFSGTGTSQGKVIVGVWVKAGDNLSGDGPGKGTYCSSLGGSGLQTELDFFFAERHTTQSNFRIDTSIILEAAPTNTTSPLYD